MTMRALTRILAASATAAALLSAAPARADSGFAAGTETVTGGRISATLSWEASDFGPKNTTLTIARHGAVAFAKRIPHVVCNGCILTGSAAGDIQIVDLDGDGEAEVVITGSSGGQCCIVMGVYDFRPAIGTYGELVQDWRSGGFELHDLDPDGVPEIVAPDVRFEDLLTNHAASYPPPAVFEYDRRGGTPQLLDITRIYPGLIRSNAAEARFASRRFHRGDPGARGFVAAYVADQYLLGRGSVGRRELDRDIARGILGRPRSARAYRKRLLTLLHRFGYR